jgi:hypothetical protein
VTRPNARSTLAAETIERIAPPSVEAFHRDYVAPRRPVVLRGLTAEWPARCGWSLDYLQRAFALTHVRTFSTDRGRIVMDSPTGAVETPVQLGAFIESLRLGTQERYVTSRLRDLPEALRNDVPPPAYSAGASWQNGNLWIGGAGTVAALHRDMADNLHAVMAGRKRFTLVAPQQSAGLYPNSLFDPFPNGSRVDIEEPDFARFPKLRDVDTLVGELEDGDVIYIPRRWWHHVRTLQTSVSVNFWWARGARHAMVLGADWLKRLRGINR